MRLRNRLALRVAIATICAHSIFSFFGGGFVSATTITPTNPSSNNEVILTDSSYTVNGTTTEYSDTVDRAEGGHTESGSADGNTITIESGTVTSFVNGGYSYSGTTNDNTVIINGGTFYGWVEGGWVVNGDALRNSVTINDGTFYAIIDGGYTYSGPANYNTVTINGGTIVGSSNGGSSGVYGGYVHSTGDASSNTVTVNDGTISGGIYGGYVASSGNVSSNTININGGTISDAIYSGYTTNGTSSNNAINIYGSPDLSGATMYAGVSGSSSTSGNSLNIYTQNLTAQNVSGFENLNIYLPEGISDGDSILTLTSSSGTDLTETAVSIGKSAGTSVTEGAQINLITNANGLTVSDIDFDNSIYEGITLKYGADLAVQDNSLMLTVGSFQGVNENTKIISDSASVIGSIVRTTTGRTIRIFEEECYKDIDSLEFELENEIRPFASISTENIRTKLGGGAYLDTKTHGIDLGYSKKFQTNHGIITLAPIFDYSSGSYDAYLPNGVHGTGDSTYFSGGAIARIARDSGLYYEGSLRYGRAESDFYANEFPIGSASTTFVRYDVGTPVISGHMHIGRFYRFGKRNKIQVYTQYAHAYQASAETDLSTGEHYEFDSLNLGTSKTGVRMISTPRDNSIFYTGLAFQYDLGNDAVAHYQDYSTPKTDTSGSTGVLELGYQYRPTEKSPWALDFNALGMVGNEKGVSFQMKIKKAF